MVNYNIKLTNVLYHWILSMASFRFCETYLLHIKLFVGNQCANSPFLGVRLGWVLFKTNVQIRWNPVYKAFHWICLVETNQLISRTSNVILTGQTCGHCSSRVAGSKRRALAFYFSGARGKRGFYPPLSTLFTPEFIRNFSQITFQVHLSSPCWKSELIRLNPKVAKKRQKHVLVQIQTVGKKSSWA